MEFKPPKSKFKSDKVETKTTLFRRQRIMIRPVTNLPLQVEPVIPTHIKKEEYDPFQPTPADEEQNKSSNEAYDPFEPTLSDNEENLTDKLNLEKESDFGFFKKKTESSASEVSSVNVCDIDIDQMLDSQYDAALTTKKVESCISSSKTKITQKRIVSVASKNEFDIFAEEELEKAQAAAFPSQVVSNEANQVESISSEKFNTRSEKIKFAFSSEINPLTLNAKEVTDAETTHEDKQPLSQNDKVADKQEVVESASTASHDDYKKVVPVIEDEPENSNTDGVKNQIQAEDKSVAVNSVSPNNTSPSCQDKKTSNNYDSNPTDMKLFEKEVDLSSIDEANVDSNSTKTLQGERVIESLDKKCHSVKQTVSNKNSEAKLSDSPNKKQYQSPYKETTRCKERSRSLSSEKSSKKDNANNSKTKSKKKSPRRKASHSPTNKLSKHKKRNKSISKNRSSRSHRSRSSSYEYRRQRSRSTEKPSHKSKRKYRNKNSDRHVHKHYSQSESRKRAKHSSYSRSPSPSQKHKKRKKSISRSKSPYKHEKRRKSKSRSVDNELHSRDYKAKEQSSSKHTKASKRSRSRSRPDRLYSPNKTSKKSSKKPSSKIDKKETSTKVTQAGLKPDIVPHSGGDNKNDIGIERSSSQSQPYTKENNPLHLFYDSSDSSVENEISEVSKKTSTEKNRNTSTSYNPSKKKKKYKKSEVCTEDDSNLIHENAKRERKKLSHQSNSSDHECKLKKKKSHHYSSESHSDNDNKVLKHSKKHKRKKHLADVNTGSQESLNKHEENSVKDQTKKQYKKKSVENTENDKSADLHSDKYSLLPDTGKNVGMVSDQKFSVDASTDIIDSNFSTDVIDSNASTDFIKSNNTCESEESKLLNVSFSPLPCKKHVESLDQSTIHENLMTVSKDLENIDDFFQSKKSDEFNINNAETNSNSFSQSTSILQSKEHICSPSPLSPLLLSPTSNSPSDFVSNLNSSMITSSQELTETPSYAETFLEQSRLRWEKSLRNKSPHISSTVTPDDTSTSEVSKVEKQSQKVELQEISSLSDISFDQTEKLKSHDDANLDTSCSVEDIFAESPERLDVNKNKLVEQRSFKSEIKLDATEINDNTFKQPTDTFDNKGEMLQDTDMRMLFQDAISLVHKELKDSSKSRDDCETKQSASISKLNKSPSKHKQSQSSHHSRSSNRYSERRKKDRRKRSRSRSYERKPKYRKSPRSPYRKKSYDDNLPSTRDQQAYSKKKHSPKQKQHTQEESLPSQGINTPLTNDVKSPKNDLLNMFLEQSAELIPKFEEIKPEEFNRSADLSTSPQPIATISGISTIFSHTGNREEGNLSSGIYDASSHPFENLVNESRPALIQIPTIDSHTSNPGKLDQEMDKAVLAPKSNKIEEEKILSPSHHISPNFDAEESKPPPPPPPPPPKVTSSPEVSSTTPSAAASLFSKLFGLSKDPDDLKNVPSIKQEASKDKDSENVLNPTQILNIAGLNPQQQSAAKDAIMSIAELSKQLQLGQILSNVEKSKLPSVQPVQKDFDGLSPVNIDSIESSAVDMYNRDKQKAQQQKKNFQDKVVAVAKAAIKPHYERREVNKEQYKDIMKRAVNKICQTDRNMEVNDVKIRRLIRRYVECYQQKNEKKKEKMKTTLDQKLSKHISDVIDDSEFINSPPSPEDSPLDDPYSPVDDDAVSVPTLLKKKPRKIVTLPDLPLPPPPPPPRPKNTM